MRLPLSISLAYTRQKVLKDPNGTTPSLSKAQVASCEALPAHLMSAEAVARRVLRHFADHHSQATLIVDRDDGVLIEFWIDSKVLLSHADFGVCEVSSRNVNQGQMAVRQLAGPCRASTRSWRTT